MPRLLLAAIALVTPAVLTGSAPRLEASAGGSSESALTHRPVAGVVQRPCIPIDDKGNKTAFSYDALDRTILQTNADTKTWAFVYDRDHNVTQVTDPNGTVVTKVYDVLNRLKSTSVARASGVGGTTAETMQYDGLSRLTRCTDDNGGGAAAQSCDYVYDSLSRVLEETFTGAKTISNVYTGDSKRLQATYPGGRVIKHTFDAIDRVKRTLDGSAGDALIAEANWIGPGLRELKRTYGNGTVYSFVDPVSGADTGHDAVQRIVRLRHLLPGGTAFVDRQYTYNRASVRTAEKRNADGGQEDRYSYDSLYRVTQTLLDQGGTGTKRDLQAVAYPGRGFTVGTTLGGVSPVGTTLGGVSPKDRKPLGSSTTGPCWGAQSSARRREVRGPSNLTNRVGGHRRKGEENH